MLLVRPICGSICSRPAHSRPCARIFGVISTHGWEFTKNSRISTPRKRNLPKQTSCRVEIWRQALAASRAADAHPDTAKLMLPAINQMIDITTTRTMATQMHPPTIIFVMLSGLALASALLAGYGIAGGKYRSWLHKMCFAVVVAVAVYVILDVEYPRLGLIRVDAFDQALVERRESMGK